VFSPGGFIIGRIAFATSIFTGGYGEQRLRDQKAAASRNYSRYGLG
jgi:hypothetical protein